MKRWLALWACLLPSCFHEEVQLLPAGGAEGADAATATARPPNGQCGGSSYQATNKALEILLLVDESGTAILPGFDCFLNINATACAGAWAVTVNEITTFVNDPRSAGISIAVRYFGSSCEPRDYETPDVPMGRLPEHAIAIMQSLGLKIPLTDTATRPALEGALTYARRRIARPDYNARMIVALIADDGPEPDDCPNNDVPATAQVAASGAASDPAIPTHVFVTTRTTELDEVARAGGTERSIAADFLQPGALAAALIGLRDRELAGLPCEYMLPAAYFERVRNPRLVNLRRDGEPLGRVQDVAACEEARGGWYYDNPDAPSRILTCPSTCSALRRGGSVDIQLDCPTVILY